MAHYTHHIFIWSDFQKLFVYWKYTKQKSPSKQCMYETNKKIKIFD